MTEKKLHIDCGWGNLSLDQTDRLTAIPKEGRFAEVLCDLIGYISKLEKQIQSKILLDTDKSQVEFLIEANKVLQLLWTVKERLSSILHYQRANQGSESQWKAVHELLKEPDHPYETIKDGVARVLQTNKRLQEENDILKIELARLRRETSVVLAERAEAESSKTVWKRRVETSSREYGLIYEKFLNELKVSQTLRQEVTRLQDQVNKLQETIRNQKPDQAHRIEELEELLYAARMKTKHWTEEWLKLVKKYCPFEGEIEGFKDESK